MQPSVRKRWKFRVNTNQLLRMRVGKRVEQNSSHHCKNSSCRADAQHEAEDRRCRESQVLPHHAQGELNVLPECLHRRLHSDSTRECWVLFVVILSVEAPFRVIAGVPGRVALSSTKKN